MKKLYWVLTIPTLIFCVQPEFWQVIKTSKPIMETYTLQMETDYRFLDMGDQLKYFHGDLGLIFPLIANFKLGLNFREVFEWKENSWIQEHRPHGSIMSNLQLWKFDVSARSRFEYRMKQDKDPAIRNRDILTIKYGKKITPLNLVPYVADEIFYDLEENELNRNRLFIGVEIQRIKWLKTMVYLMQQMDLKDATWESTNIIGLAFAI